MEQMLQGNLHASEGGMYMGHEEANSTMKDGVGTFLITYLHLDYYHFSQIQRRYSLRS